MSIAAVIRWPIAISVVATVAVSVDDSCNGFFRRITRLDCA